MEHGTRVDLSHKRGLDCADDERPCIDDGSGPVTLVAVPSVLPREVTPLRTWEERARLAAHISRHLFTVSPRTLETWPVQTVIVNKRALLHTHETIAHAERLLAEAEARAVRQGGSP